MPPRSVRSRPSRVHATEPRRARRGAGRRWRLRTGRPARLRGVPLALACALACATPLAAQGQGKGPPDRQSVTVSRLADLTFGPVVGGLPSVIRPEDPTAAQFEVKLRGRPTHTVTLTLALPRDLTSGPNRLPITFDAASAAWATRDAPDARTIFDPARGTTITLDQRGPKSILVWVGGVLEPARTQAAGDYADQLTITAVEN